MMSKYCNTDEVDEQISQLVINYIDKLLEKNFIQDYDYACFNYFIKCSDGYMYLKCIDSPSFNKPNPMFLFENEWLFSGFIILRLPISNVNHLATKLTESEYIDYLQSNTIYPY